MERRNIYNILGGNFGRKRALEKPRLRQEDNIKMKKYVLNDSILGSVADS
jgi:hypothetical protein